MSGKIHVARRHDSALKHVTGQALYIDDIAAPEGLLHAYLGTSGIAHGKLISLDLAAVRAAPGVVAVGVGASGATGAGPSGCTLGVIPSPWFTCALRRDQREKKPLLSSSCGLIADPGAPVPQA